MPPVTKFKRIDIRTLLKRGGDVFSKIVAKAEALETNEGLIVVSPFLPSPLLELLNGRGFASKLERGTDGAWIVYFWREAKRK
jgi:hypothetical protein